MQVLKDEVRDNIKVAALKAFTEKGYRNASMREIASFADMSVGNLYRYFKNKEELFAYLIKPLIEMFEKAEIDEEKEFTGDLLDVNFLEHSEIIDFMVNSRAIHREELFILFLRAEESPFSGAKKRLQEFVEKQIQRYILEGMSVKEFVKGHLFINYMASSIVDTFCVILEGASDNEEFILNMMEYSEYFVKPSLRNLIAIKNGEAKFRRISDEEIHRRFSRHSDCCGDSSTKSH